MNVCITKVKLTTNKCHQARFGNLYTKIEIAALYIILIQGAEVVGTCCICCHQYLWHIIIFKRINQCKRSHNCNIVKFDIWNDFVLHQV